MRGFKLPILLSGILHLVLLGALVFSVSWQVKLRPVNIPTEHIVKAQVMDNSLIKEAEKRKRVEQEAKRQAVEKKRQQAEEKKRQEQLRLKAEREKKLALEAKRKEEEKQRQQEEERKKREAEKKKQEAEKKKREEEARKRLAEEKKRQEEAKRRAEAERLAKEEEALLAQMHADIAASEVDKYVGYIRDKVNRLWIRPADLPHSLTCKVRVRIIPGGDVSSVSIIRSSGSDAFDRSVEAAVYKASPLPVPSDIRQFNRLREIEFEFNPGK